MQYQQSAVGETIRRLRMEKNMSQELLSGLAGIARTHLSMIASTGCDTMQTEYAEKYITLGLKIAYYRKKRGYTQEVFAEKIGKSLNFLAQVEGTGTVRGVSLETLFKIADVLQIPPAKLLEDD